MPNYSDTLQQVFLNRAMQFAPPPKRKVFISYHHQDQVQVDTFRRLYDDTYNIFTDCSLDEAIESNDLDYVNRTIREEYITGTSVTIVLCGANTHKRKCVDWEIYSTLSKRHALLGIALPESYDPIRQAHIVPDRLNTNYQNGYAHVLIGWPSGIHVLKNAIELTLSKANLFEPDNSVLKMSRNL